MLKKECTHFKGRRAVPMKIQNFVIVSFQIVTNNHYDIESCILELLVISIVLFFYTYAL